VDNFSFSVSRSLSGSTCLAKYCAKKLPPTTSVVTIQNGKAVFVREAPKQPLGNPALVNRRRIGMISCGELVNRLVTGSCAGAEPKPLLRTILHPSVGLEPKVIIPNPNRSARSMDLDAVGCAHGAPRPATGSFGDAAGAGATQEQRLGWPLLRRVPPVTSAAPSPKHEEPRKQSVVQWVMSLPRRTSPSAPPEPQTGLAADMKAMLDGGGARCRWFRYEELYECANHFSSGSNRSSPSHSSTTPWINWSASILIVRSWFVAENLIGNGGNSRVYRGSLACGEPVAIKLSKASAEASKDFLREVDIITKLKHPRIVPLIGVCVEGPHLISVYRYLPRGSLEDNLHGIPARFSSSTLCTHLQFISYSLADRLVSFGFGVVFAFGSKEQGIQRTD
jgi:hypothetical protein